MNNDNENGYPKFNKADLIKLYDDIEKGDGQADLMSETEHKADFIRPPNRLKTKVGSGGLNEKVLEKAEAILRSNTIDFVPAGLHYLGQLSEGIREVDQQIASESQDSLDLHRYATAYLAYPAMQLKANGGMFHYEAITETADILLRFLESLKGINADALEVVRGFERTFHVILTARLSGPPSSETRGLIQELEEVCQRFYRRNPGLMGETEEAAEEF